MRLPGVEEAARGLRGSCDQSEPRAEPWLQLGTDLANIWTRPRGLVDDRAERRLAADQRRLDAWWSRDEDASIARPARRSRRSAPTDLDRAGHLGAVSSTKSHRCLGRVVATNDQRSLADQSEGQAATSLSRPTWHRRQGRGLARDLHSRSIRHSREAPTPCRRKVRQVRVERGIERPRQGKRARQSSRAPPPGCTAPVPGTLRLEHPVLRQVPAWRTRPRRASRMDESVHRPSGHGRGGTCPLPRRLLDSAEHADAVGGGDEGRSAAKASTADYVVVQAGLYRHFIRQCSDLRFGSSGSTTLTRQALSRSRRTPWLARGSSSQTRSVRDRPASVPRSRDPVACRPAQRVERQRRAKVKMLEPLEIPT